MQHMLIGLALAATGSCTALLMTSKITLVLTAFGEARFAWWLCNLMFTTDTAHAATQSCGNHQLSIADTWLC